MEENIIIAIITSGAFSAIIGAVIAGIQSKSMMRNALKQILYYQIKDNCEKAIERGSVDSEDLKATLEAWETYHDKLKGNGYLNVLITKFNGLPITKE